MERLLLSSTETHHEPNRKYYDRISHLYDAIADSGEHKARETGKAALKLCDAESVLEIGFGTGNSLVTFAKQIGKRGKVTGIDVSSGMKEVAGKKVADAGLDDRVDLVLGDA